MNGIGKPIAAQLSVIVSPSHTSSVLTGGLVTFGTATKFYYVF
jgi:hypothetical protein